MMNRKLAPMFTVLLSAISVVILAAIPQASASGSKAGNGGHGVRCQGGRAELLDLYEAREFYGLPFGSNWFATIDDEISRIESETASVLGPNEPMLSLFLDARLLLQSLELAPGPLGFTQDGGFVLGTIPPECELVQLAVRSTFASQNTHVTVLADDWNMMLSTERALLLIHEAAHSRFAMAKASGLPSTLAIRQFVALISAPIDVKIKKAGMIRRLIRTQAPLLPSEMQP